MNKQKAFTLAEILITLSILGVVAAITIPSAIQREIEKTTVVKVKKMYSTLTTAYDQYMVENNWAIKAYQNTDDDLQAIYDDLVAPYMQVSYVAGTNSERKKKIMYEKRYKWLNNPNSGNTYATENNYAFQLKDGSVLWFYAKTSSGNVKFPTFRYDVNGKKGPNTLGRDTFFFTFTDQGVIPGKFATYQTPDTLATKCRIDSTSNDEYVKSGASCAAYIILHGNMNYLK